MMLTQAIWAQLKDLGDASRRPGTRIDCRKISVFHVEGCEEQGRTNNSDLNIYYFTKALVQFVLVCI